MYTVALIDEARCIGCTKCIAACPVDAIIGAQGLMHSVITSECIGCKLCLPPCPVDCIEIKELEQKPFNDGVARSRVKTRKARLAAQRTEEANARARKKAYDPLAAVLGHKREPH